MHLAIIKPEQVDKAWADGAASLGEACDTSDGDITGSQLKMILSRGERILVAIVEDEKPIGWGVLRIDQLPNVRALHITSLVCHNGQVQRFFEDVKGMAYRSGCSEVRWSCKPAQARLYMMKLSDSIEATYTTYRVKL